MSSSLPAAADDAVADGTTITASSPSQLLTSDAQQHSDGATEITTTDETDNAVAAASSSSDGSSSASLPVHYKFTPPITATDDHHRVPSRPIILPPVIESGVTSPNESPMLVSRLLQQQAGNSTVAAPPPPQSTASPVTPYSPPISPLNAAIISASASTYNYPTYSTAIMASAPQTPKTVATKQIIVQGQSTSSSSSSSTDKQSQQQQPQHSWHDFHHLLPLHIQRLCHRGALFMDGPLVLLIISIATLITIFLDDIKVASFGPTADLTFCAITVSFFVLFGVELLLNCILKAGYFLSFFFLLDLISCFSLLPDIPWFWNPMIGLDPNDFGESHSYDAQTEVVRIQRISSNGEKLIRVLKFVKLIRLGRIAKLFEMAQRTLRERARLQRIEERIDDGKIHTDDYTQSSQVGETLSEQTIRNVVLLVLLMLFGIPLLQSQTENGAHDFIIGEFNLLANNKGILGKVYTNYSQTEGVYHVMTEDEYTQTVVAWNIQHPPPNSSSPSTTPPGLFIFTPSLLSTLLLSYNSTLGQSQDKSSFTSGAINETYLMEVIPTQNYSVAFMALNSSRSLMEAQWSWMLSYYQDQILYLRVRGKYYSNTYENPGLFKMRRNEMKAVESDLKVYVDEDTAASASTTTTATAGTSNYFISACIGVFSQQDIIRSSAQYSIWRTFTTLILLFIGALAFDYNNKRMVIRPIERMIATIVQLRKNPLAKAITQEDHSHPGGAGAGSSLETLRKQEEHTESLSHNETGMLERTLQKLTGLLQVGFGDAGSRMIQKCMQQNSEGSLDPLVDGTRILGIFGFCDIRRFTDATECLREDVMMYVNEIASIVHSHVSINDGHPNKNVGDAFLVMWKLMPYGLGRRSGDVDGVFECEELFQINEKQPQYIRSILSQRLKRETALHTQAERDYYDDMEQRDFEKLFYQRAKSAGITQFPPRMNNIITPLTLAQLSVLADKAVVSFLRIIIDLDASEVLRSYENDSRITSQFSDFIVELGFGLHCGWAIEGPIGSRYKIDASYLSPHVNLSETLQDLTKVYGTPLLCSGEFYTLLSPYLKSYMRRIDVIKVSGRDIPMNLYCFDIHPNSMKTVIARQVPHGYDVDADIEVVDFKSSHFMRFKGKEYWKRFGGSVDGGDGTGSGAGGDADGKQSGSSGKNPTNGIMTRRPNGSQSNLHGGGGGANRQPSPPPASASPPPVSPPQHSPSPFIYDHEPLSPQPPHDPYADPLETHELFINPSLNPNDMDFSRYTYSGAERTQIHSLGPIAMYHLVYNFRLSVLQCGIPEEFYDLYEKGLESYLQGDWFHARQTMESCLLLYPQDKPTRVILDTMAAHQYQAPMDWPGWHEV